MSFKLCNYKIIGMQSKTLDKSINPPPTTKSLTRHSLHSSNKWIKTSPTVILSISRNERRYIFVHGCIYHFLVPLSSIFENVVKVLSGRVFDISFFSEVPLLSGKTMAILASFEKKKKNPFGAHLIFTHFCKVFGTVFCWIRSHCQDERRLSYRRKGER